MHSLVTLVERKGVECHVSWVTLEALVCNGVDFQQEYMEHTGDGGRKNHREIDFGC